MSSSKISPLSSLSSLRERSSPVSPLPFPVLPPEGRRWRMAAPGARSGPLGEDCPPADGSVALFSPPPQGCGYKPPRWGYNGYTPSPSSFPLKDWKATRSTRDSLAIWMARSSLAYRSFRRKGRRAASRAVFRSSPRPVLLQQPHPHLDHPGI